MVKRFPGTERYQSVLMRNRAISLQAYHFGDNVVHALTLISSSLSTTLAQKNVLFEEGRTDRVLLVSGGQ